MFVHFIKPPQTLLKAIHQLKRRDDIVVTKPDKGSGVVEYLRLLADAAINNVTKFRIVKPDRPKCRGRPQKHYHPLLEKEKELESLVRRILPTAIAESVRPSGSRLAHLYGLPKTHKEKLAMRPILSATQTYNYALTKWLDDKLKPLVTNQYMISDTFEFVNEVYELVINNGDILVSYDVSSLFTNRDLKIRRRRVSTTADLVEGGWGEVAVAMAGKLSLRYARDGGAFSKFRKCFKNSAKCQFKDLCMFSCRLS